MSSRLSSAQKRCEWFGVKRDWVLLWRLGFMLCIGLSSRLAFGGAGLHAEWYSLGYLRPLLCSSRFGLLGYTPVLLYVFVDFRMKPPPCMHVLVL